MTKILSSNTVQSALQTLLFSDDTLQQTQQRVTSGLKIANAADNSGYWSTATNLRSDSGVLSSVSDALDLGASKADTAYEAVSSMIDVVDQIMIQLTTAHETGADRGQINNAINALKSNLYSVAQAASFSGDNWLFNTSELLPSVKSVPFAFNKSTTGAISLQYLEVRTSQTTMVDTNDAERGLMTKSMDASARNPDVPSAPREYYLLNANSATAAAGTEIMVSDSTTQAELDDMVYVVGNIQKQLNVLGGSIGSMSNRMDQQTVFISALKDSMDKSVSRLVDANMEEESTRLTAYKTQRDLAVEVVSMANNHEKSLAGLLG
ncbi:MULTISPECIES: flagellin N-terminal helical domain-containing protein [unclassified Rhizobium]|uniref:flagellin N-terminal helical domain-containing protein n=1 Tax=unclassified Rhizobium TaxID=2613769 RepID=UPI001780FB59|nr:MULTISPECIES: flagellin [unclassified Rhizobium]MBD8685927.1 flagellin [Rhizobium sp. CFBP 13644]MBD8690400.1 flagellin [Rhizobium sp. CFBP 13717]